MHYAAMIAEGRNDESVFNRVFEVVRHRALDPGGKGMKRHGKGRPFFQQPAFQVRPHSPGFFTGQAQKKIIEASEWENDEHEELSSNTIIEYQVDEYIDAIIYLAFEIMFLSKQRFNQDEGREKTKDQTTLGLSDGNEVAEENEAKEG